MTTSTQTTHILAAVQEGASATEQLAPGLTFQRLYHGRIMTFRFTDQSHGSVDAWAERCIAESLAIPEGEYSIAIHDFSQCKYFSMSPHIRQRALEMSRRFHYLEGFSAVIVPKTPAFQLAALFLRLLRINIQTRLFFTYEAGLSWLKESADRLADKPVRQP